MQAEEYPEHAPQPVQAAFVMPPAAGHQPRVAMPARVVPQPIPAAPGVPAAGALQPALATPARARRAEVIDLVTPPFIDLSTPSP